VAGRRGYSLTERREPTMSRPRCRRVVLGRAGRHGALCLVRGAPFFVAGRLAVSHGDYVRLLGRPAGRRGGLGGRSSLGPGWPRGWLRLRREQGMGALWSACEVVINGEFKEAVEQQPSTTGATPVEPEYELSCSWAGARRQPIPDGFRAANVWPARRRGELRAAGHPGSLRGRVRRVDCVVDGRSRSSRGRGIPAKRQ
jgi:hypothetical protein